MADEIQKALLGQPTINKDYTTTQVEYVKGIFTLIAGLVGILVLMKSFFTHELDREKAQLEMTKAQNERFAKALEHLGDDAIDIRLGGIFALEALMNENPEHFASRVITQLCAYSSNRGGQLNALWKKNVLPERDDTIDKYAINSLWYSGNRDTNLASLTLPQFSARLHNLEKPPSLPPFADLETTAQILCTTPHWITYYKKPLQLRNVFWCGFKLQNAFNLQKADLTGANLEQAEFSGKYTMLYLAKLDYANLAFADFDNATLTRASFYFSTLQFTKFKHSNLDGAEFIKGKNIEFFDTVLRNLHYLDQEDFFRMNIFLECDLSNLFYFNRMDNPKQNSCIQSLVYQASVKRSQISDLKQFRFIPAQGVDIEHLRKNLHDDSLWEQHPETLTDEEVIDRLKLVVVDDAPIPPPSADAETT